MWIPVPQHVFLLTLLFTLLVLTIVCLLAPICSND